MERYGIRRRSNVAPTMGYVKRLIQDAVADGSSLKLFQMEQRGLVVYRAKDGTYELTDEGRKFLMGGQR